MYQTSFGFAQRPFSATPQSDWFFQSESASRAYESIASCIERAAGPAMMIGGAGSGKTLLCQLLAQNFRGLFSVVTLNSARLCTRRALLQSILFELGLPFREMEEGELRLTLIDYLNPSQECPNGMLLIVDEAQVLPTRLLEEIRMITNLVRDGQPRVRLVLAGNQSLEERFTHPQLASLNQRVAVRSYLKPLSNAETRDYVKFHLEKAGGPIASRLFADDAIEAVYHASEGVPRLINQVCDHALLIAAADGKTSIDAALIAESWSDIQQLPTPWYNNAANLPVSEVEFGELDAAAPSTESFPEAEETTEVKVVEDLYTRNVDVASQLAAMAREVTADEPKQTSEAATSSQIAADESLETTLDSSENIESTDEQISESSFSSEITSTVKSDVESIVESETSSELTTSELQPTDTSTTDTNDDPFGEDFESETVVVDPTNNAFEYAAMNTAAIQRYIEEQEAQLEELTDDSPTFDTDVDELTKIEPLVAEDELLSPVPATPKPDPTPDYAVVGTANEIDPLGSAAIVRTAEPPSSEQEPLTVSKEEAESVSEAPNVVEREVLAGENQESTDTDCDTKGDTTPESKIHRIHAAENPSSGKPAGVKPIAVRAEYRELFDRLKNG